MMPNLYRAHCPPLPSTNVLFQVRNPHNHLGDFEAELPLYERADALVKFLLEYLKAETMSNAVGLTWSVMEDLAVTMYEYGIVGEEDVALTQVGLPC